MKKIFTTIGALLITVASWAQLTGVTLGGSGVITATGGNISVSLTKAPSNATLAGVTWDISDMSLASFSNETTTGVTLNAKRNGTVTVTATAFDEMATVTGSHVVVISNQIESLTLAGAGSLVSSISQDVTVLTVTGNLSSVSASDITWSISPSTLAGVKSNSFNLQAKGNGEVTIQAMSKADNTVMSNSITITLSGFVAVSSVSIGGGNMLITPGEQKNLSISYLPADATTPVISWSTSDNCAISVNSSGAIKAKRNGTYTITGTVANGGSSVSQAYVIEITGQLPYFENFAGTWDGNPFGNVPYKNMLFGNVTGYYAGGANGWMGSDAANKYFIKGGEVAPNFQSTTTDKLDLYFSTPGVNFDGFGPFWVGVGSPYFIFNGGGPWDFGCGLDIASSINKNMIIDIENKETAALQLQFNLYDQSNGGFYGGSGDAFVVTIPGNTRQFVNLTIPNTYSALKALTFRSKEFVGNVIIYGFAVGADPVSGITLNGNNVTSLLGSTTVSAEIAGGNVAKYTTFSLMESTPGIATITGSTWMSATIKATGLDNGTVTVMGTAWGPEAISGYKIISISNQKVVDVDLVGPATIVGTTPVVYSFAVTPSIYQDSVSIQSVIISSSPNGAAYYNDATNELTASVTGVVTVTIIAVKAFNVNVVMPGTITSTSIITVSVAGVSTVPGTTTGINSTESNAVVLYPNPATENVSIQGADVVSAVVVNTLGQVVTSSSSSTISLSGIPAGLYKVIITTPLGSVSKTLVKK